jgi:hypothetical protein
VVTFSITPELYKQLLVTRSKSPACCGGFALEYGRRGKSQYKEDSVDRHQEVFKRSRRFVLWLKADMKIDGHESIANAGYSIQSSSMHYRYWWEGTGMLFNSNIMEKRVFLFSTQSRSFEAELWESVALPVAALTRKNLSYFKPRKLYTAICEAMEAAWLEVEEDEPVPILRLGTHPDKFYRDQDLIIPPVPLSRLTHSAHT